MRNHLLRRFVLGLAVLLLAGSALAARRAEHVFIVSLDGGNPAVLRESRMPVLDQLVAEGAVTWKAQTIVPSLTLPAHVSMLTGVRPAKHGITWNSYQPARGVVNVPTVFALAKRAGCRTAMFVGKDKFKHLLQPGTVDEFGYYERRPDGSSSSNTVGGYFSRDIAAAAASYLRAQKPNLCFIHFTDTDSAGHQFGWGSPEQRQAFGDEDTALGVIVKAIREAGLATNSVLIVTADHGGHKKTHGSQLADDMTIPWLAWGQGVKKHTAITAPVMICDTTATALWLLDVPRPAELDGKPVTSAFE